MNSLLLAANGSAIATAVALVLLFVFGLVGLFRGFVKSFLKTFGTIFAIILAVLLCQKFTALLERWFGFAGFFTDRLSGVVKSIFGEDVTGMTVQEIQSTNQLISATGNKLSSWIANIIISIKNNGVAQDTTVGEVLCGTFGFYLTTAISFFILFIIFKILFFFLGKLAKSLHKIKIIGAVDSVLGLALGVIKGIIFIQILTMLIGIIPIDFCQQANAYINQSDFICFINRINIIGLIISSFNQIDLISFLKVKFA